MARDRAAGGARGHAVHAGDWQRAASERRPLLHRAGPRTGPRRRVGERGVEPHPVAVRHERDARRRSALRAGAARRGSSRAWLLRGRRARVGRLDRHAAHGPGA